MGFADLGFMGSEIHTPTLDMLAANGLVMSAMYNCARCCPTRASLLTGLYPHSAGIGHMGTNLGTPEYQGFLRDDATTIAELLQSSGYRTCMSGKWHVGGDLMASESDTWRPGEPEFPTPRQRGFDRFYGTLDGATSFFSPHYVMRDDERIEVDPTGYYYTDAITDEAIGMVTEATELDQPFFLYLAHTAPHWPLHAPEEDIATYESTYLDGWDATRTARHEQILANGVLEHPWELSARDEQAPPWPTVAQPRWEASKMATYAAMVDHMDQSLGRLITALRDLGELDNTLILFLSDNGGCAEFMAEDGWAQSMPNVTNDGREMQMGNIPGIRPGGALTYQSYDLPWANVSNAPFRLFKHWVHEGGISTPLIAHWPDGLAATGISHAASHVVDVLPTILDAAGVPYPSEINGRAVQPLEGESLLPLFAGSDWQRDTPIFWEHEGNSAVRLGDFKLVRQFDRPWELYNMRTDRTELHDLAGSDVSREEMLAGEYESWAKRIGVIDWALLQPALLAAWGIDTPHG